jgi:hypothetical protein
MATQEKTLHIDIEVKLTEVKVVFSIASLSFEGDLPACIFHLQLIVNDIANWKAKSQVIAVFHTNAGSPLTHSRCSSTASLRATATTARFLAFFPPRAASFRPHRRRSLSSPKGPRM